MTKEVKLTGIPSQVKLFNKQKCIQKSRCVCLVTGQIEEERKVTEKPAGGMLK